jgi:hypothetical protein
MADLKITDLASKNISLSDFMIKADSNGLMTKNTVENLSNVLNTVGEVGFKGSVASTDATVGSDGWYFAEDSGTYTNNGGLVIDISNNLAIIIVSNTQTTFSKIDIPLNITFDATPIEGSTNAVTGNGVFDALALKANKSNIFASTATSANIPAISAFIKDIKIVTGLSSSSRYYLDEFVASGGGYKVVIRDISDVAVFNSTFTYVAPSTNPTQLNDVVEWTNSGVTIIFTLDWSKYFAVIWSTTSLASHELNNGNIFANKINDVKTQADTNATNLSTETTNRTDADIVLQNQINVLGLENPVPNIVPNADLTTTTGWTNIGGVLTDGVIYFGQQNYYLSQVIMIDEKPIGTKFVFSAKMKSIAESDYLLKVTFLNNGSVVSGSTFFIEKDTDSSFLLADGYYQILKYFTTTGIVDQVNVELKAKISGSTAYASGEGVFATQPYIATYEDGQEFYFTENNYFPPNYITDFSRFALQANELNSVAKTALKNEIFADLVEYDTTVKVNNLGDSYTELGYDNNRGYIFFTANYLGLDKLTNFGNYGIGGTRLANNSVSTTDANAMVNRYNVVPFGDLLVIMGGFNDNSTPFGTWTEKLGSVATKSDTNTIWGAFCTIIEGRKTQFPYLNENVALMTYPYTQGSLDKVALNQTIRDVADYYNLPLLDLEKECGIVDGFNASLNRTSLSDGVTWIDERRISFTDGKTIWNISTNPTSSANIYSYHENFIPVDYSLYQYINRSTQSNILQYAYNGGVSGTDADYDYIGYDLNSSVYETKLEPNCTHLRFSVQTTAKTYKYSIVDGEYVTDNTHLNLLGMRNKVAPLYTQFLKEILKRK